jgi:tRNA-2-methylthio-N6-dimethylallyladenosine synthase
MVLGPQAYHRLPEMVARATRAAATGKSAGLLDTDFPAESKFDVLPRKKFGVASSAFLTVQEGCDKFCAFCVVPYTRGAEYSRPVTAVVDEAQSLVEAGAKEITLLGQNVNAYHGKAADGSDWDLGRLILELAKVDGLARIRYTTSYPSDMTDSLYEAHRDCEVLMPYLHLPVQSGSDRILQAMNRRNDRAQYFSVVEKLRQMRPDIAMSGDFIVGFPGETDADFEDTMSLVRSIGYAQAYSFKYSPRPGTPAAALTNQVAETVKSERLAQLQELLNQQQRDFNAACAGRTMPVLLDRIGRHAGQLVGRSPFMQSVHLTAQESLLGQICRVEILDGSENSLAGQLAKDDDTKAA